MSTYIRWPANESSSVVNAIGAIDSQTANANALVIVGNTLYAQSASATNPGMVNTTTQTFAGNKTFTGTITGTYIQLGAATASANTPLAVRTDQAAITEIRVVNGTVGGTSQMRMSGQADDLILTSNSAATGANINSGPAFTGGLSLIQQGANPINLSTNGSNRFTISGAGVVTIGNGTTNQHALNTLLQANGAQTATMTNLPAAATATLANGWIKISINGTTSYMPFWQ